MRGIAVPFYLIICLLMPTPGWSTGQELASDAAPFRVVITRAGESLSLECRQGCMWKHVTRFECPVDECAATIRQSSTQQHHGGQGISLEGGAAFIRVPAITTNTFEFTVVPKTDQLDLKCLHGCAWEVLVVDCRDNECIATVDEIGVSLGPQLPEPASLSAVPPQDPNRAWPQCMIGQLVMAHRAGGPITFEIAFDEAKQLCMEREASLESAIETLSAKQENLYELVRESYQKFWTQLSAGHNKGLGQ